MAGCLQVLTRKKQRRRRIRKAQQSGNGGKQEFVRGWKVQKPDPNSAYPIPGYEKEIYVKPTITNPNIAADNPAKPIRKMKMSIHF